MRLEWGYRDNAKPYNIVCGVHEQFLCRFEIKPETAQKRWVNEWTQHANAAHQKYRKNTHFGSPSLSSSSTSVYQIAVCAHTINHITFRILKIGKILMHVAEIPFAHFIVEPKNYNLWNATTTPKRNKTISIHFAAFMPLPCAFR